VRNVDPDRRVEQGAGEMVRGACSAEPCAFRLVRLGVGDELRQVVGNKSCASSTIGCSAISATGAKSVAALWRMAVSVWF
jgi:hypothetical protein